MIPDKIHIDRLREALWYDRSSGHAAIMIGAGFSRNATSRRPGAPTFPLWDDIACKFAAALYPNDEQGRESALKRACSTSGALRVADEYKAAFGRQALDRLLIQMISDDDYLPGKLHRLLLKLPWSDVFTTNYETLLERAALGAFDRQYSVVQTTSDLPGAPRPRIVKLHGSFPSVRPFILTEEDFRTYPRLFAPMVNMVQQSMMENVFCLVGFSGDDPNSLAWTGWVRDNLAHAAPRIYLCGLHDHSQAQMRLLHDRGVVPIDLSPLVGKNVPDRHRKALEAFLLYLEAGEPPDPLHWPEIVVPERTERSEGVPTIDEAI
jgi:hypothetical protein